MRYARNSGELGTSREESTAKLSWLERAWHRARTVAAVGFAQAIVQLISLVTGILVVRLLPAREYAFYTLSVTMIGSLGVLGDSGIATGAMAEGGKKWNDRQWLGQVLVTSFSLRRIFAPVALGAVVPVLIWMLVANGASWVTTTLLSASAAISFMVSADTSVYWIGPALHQRLAAAQSVAVTQSVFRLLGTGMALLVLPFAPVATALATVSLHLTLRRIKQICLEVADFEVDVNPEMRARIMQIVWRRLPECIYYCFAGQVTVWIISLFGNTTMLAQVGALGRISQVMIVLTGITNAILVPRFARLSPDRRLICLRFAQALGFLAICGLALCVLIIVFRAQILWTLGPTYRDLRDEVVLVLIGALLNVLSSAAFAMSTARGYVLNPFVYIALNIVSQIVAVLLLDIRTVSGVLEFSIATAAFGFVLISCYALYRGNREAAVTPC